MEGIGSIISIVIFILLFWLILIRPQQKRQKQVREMQSQLQKGDSIITIGGLHGVIHALNEGTIIIEAEDGTRLTYDRSAVREVVQSD